LADEFVSLVSVRITPMPVRTWNTGPLAVSGDAATRMAMGSRAARPMSVFRWILVDGTAAGWETALRLGGLAAIAVGLPGL
jgi:hypothetical protein